MDGFSWQWVPSYQVRGHLYRFATSPCEPSALLEVQRLNEEETLATDADTSDSPPLAKLDLTKYRTDDLAGQLAELISVPEALLKVLKATALVAALAVAACFLIHALSDISLSSV